MVQELGLGLGLQVVMVAVEASTLVDYLCGAVFSGLEVEIPLINTQVGV